MKCRCLMLGMLALCWSSPVLAADRLTDRDVKALVARIEEGRDRFDDALDDRLKHSIVRGPSGEVDVDRFLNDFQEGIDRLEDRLEPDYAASAEAATLLRQATDIDGFFRRQPPGTRGESEWNRLVTDLKTLATAYGAEFPLVSGAPVRRIGDREVATTLEEIARGASRLKKSLDNELKKDSAVDREARQAIVDEADQLSKDAKSARERVKGSEPSSAEAERVLARATKLQAFIGSYRMPASASIWT
ncbi:MAG TPA: hypothetical protein VF190_04690, partial [Rhodothermales bacterium]